ncbi:zinc-binding alcohol dehydrogenase/oxidoreductase [Melghirimyces profundicolus]|uniref:Zinc-binding alcohol dehydrogenase/oxidoreductase n=1 Tax=Melghirimyces profundicolus TaxID=1242148 RepID=A0A2T6BGA9_9BACL|nr:zinc-binding dehydrogenase [Melghirimyces profundicolus]PTX55097.1 zinc-binding alcohol dehydrogenase/oxidoreductase [Melghirimyces profundicolus]
MKAVVHHQPEGFDGLKVTAMEEPTPGPGEVTVALKASGLNHRDIWTLFRKRESSDPVILGSDGAGVVKAVGEGVESFRVGQEVVINPSLGWPVKSEAPPAGFEILGAPTHGTFAEEIRIRAENVEPKPTHLTWAEAGVLPLAALTAYRALFTRGQVKEGEHLLIPGIGSGVATFLLQMAKAAGARVTVTSRSEEKRKQALELGADAAIDSHGDWAEQMKGEQVDLVIDSVGPATFDQCLDRLRPGGRLVNFGETSGKTVEIPLRPFFFGQFTLMGTTMGSTEEFREMLRFVSEHRIRPVMDRTYPLSEARQAFLRMEEGKQFGKIGFENA